VCEPGFYLPARLPTPLRPPPPLTSTASRFPARLPQSTDAEAVIECIPCLTGYCDEGGMTSQLSCTETIANSFRVGRGITVGATKAVCECSIGFYAAGADGVPLLNTSGVPCLPCPSGAVCSGMRTAPNATAGYWTTAVGRDLYKCENSEVRMVMV
jgi:hypothetical protein